MMSVSVCVCVCVCVFVCRCHVFGTTRPIFTSFRACYLWRIDMLCTSGFIDDVIFAHKPMLVDVAAQLKYSVHAALGLAINYTQ